MSLQNSQFNTTPFQLQVSHLRMDFTSNDTQHKFNATYVFIGQYLEYHWAENQMLKIGVVTYEASLNATDTIFS